MSVTCELIQPVETTEGGSIDLTKTVKLPIDPFVGLEISACDCCDAVEVRSVRCELKENGSYQVQVFLASSYDRSRDEAVEHFSRNGWQVFQEEFVDET